MEENKRRFGLRTLVVASVAYVFAAVAMLGWFLSLLNVKSDTAFAIGAGGILAIVITTLTVLPWFIRLCRAVGEDVKRAASLLILMLVIPVAGCGCERVGPGYVGIKVNMAGGARGVQDVPVVTGWAFYNPITENVLEYPTFVQTASWSEDEQVTFNSKEGLLISGDISISYQLQQSKVPAFYVKFRSDDLSAFTHGYLRNVARDQFNEVAGTYAIDELYGPKKEQFVRGVRDRINSELKTIGVVVEQFGFIGAPRPPQSVVNAINAKMAATQQAIQRENEIRTAEAEAKKAVAQAQGQADSKIKMAEGQARANQLIAEGNAKARVAIATGEAEANKLLAASISASLLSWRQLENAQNAIQKWDGRRPQVEGSGAGLLMQLPEAKP